MAKRMILMLLVTAAFIAALGYVKFWQIQEAIGQAAAFKPPPSGGHDHRRSGGKVG